MAEKISYLHLQGANPDRQVPIGVSTDQVSYNNGTLTQHLIKLDERIEDAKGSLIDRIIVAQAEQAWVRHSSGLVNNIQSMTNISAQYNHELTFSDLAGSELAFIAVIPAGEEENLTNTTESFLQIIINDNIIYTDSNWYPIVQDKNYNKIICIYLKRIGLNAVQAIGSQCLNGNYVSLFNCIIPTEYTLYDQIASLTIKANDLWLTNNTTYYLDVLKAKIV